MGEEIHVRITSTIPIFCKKDAVSCEVLLSLYNPNTVTTAACSRTIKNSHWVDHDQFTEFTDTTNVLPLFAAEDDFRKADTYTTRVQFKVINFGSWNFYTLPEDANAKYPIFEGYQLPPIEVG